MIALIFAITTVLTPTLHVDAPFTLSEETIPGTMPVECGHNAPYMVQFVWRLAPGESANYDAVHAQLMPIVERVNFLFWLDANHANVYQQPAWKLTTDCRLDVQIIGTNDEMPPTDFTKTIIVEDSKAYCGLAYLYADTRPGPENGNNSGTYAFVSRGCLNAHTVAHELLHALGAVQLEAPNSDGGYHARETGDVMSRHLVRICDRVDTLDCNKDDYYSLSPTGYLVDHWNSANSVYLLTLPKHTVVMTPFYRSDK
jgi:hypothetical protein